ncbi:MAG: porin [Pseudomonadales bacterium]|nr:porin [Pseudomonadales bacterium]
MLLQIHLSKIPFFLSLCMALSCQLTLANPIQIGGFFSTGVAHASRQNALLTNNLIEDKTNYLSDTVFGLQLDTRLSQRSRFSAQLQAEDRNNTFDLEAEWLFISHELSPNIELRAGRLRLPLYFISETINVDQSYDWLRPPMEVYALTGGLTNYNGVSALFKHHFNASSIEAELYKGQAKDITIILNSPLFIDTHQFYGGQLTYTADHIAARISRVHLDITATFSGNSAPLDLGEVDISVAGLHYTRNNWGGLVEYGDVKVLDKGKINAYYVTLTYNFAKVTPNITFSRSRTNTLFTITTVQGDSVSAGFRYNLTDRSSMKLEILRGRLLDGPAYTFTDPPPNFDEKVTLYSMTLNLIF